VGVAPSDRLESRPAAEAVTPPGRSEATRLGTPRREAVAQRQRHRPIVRIHLLGPMRATTYLGQNVLPHGKRARAVLGYLCLAAEDHVARTDLAGLLWDRLPEAVARTNLRQALRELSSTFGGLAKELIVAGRDAVKLNTDACWVDALAALALDPARPDFPHVDLPALCRGELLENLDGTSASFDRWLLEERSRIGERLAALLERQLERAGTKSGSASRRLARALAEMRERAHTHRAYERHRQARHKTFQVEWPASKSALLVGNGTSADDRNRSGQSTVPYSTSRGDRLRVGVLPFLTHTTEREENLAFSLSQEIAAALARFRWFDVIAPMSLRPAPAKGFVDEHQLRRMALDYVVDGTVSSNGGHLQISVRLMDLAEYARPVWSECFDLAIGELHRLNELVTTRIVGRIDPVILSIEGQPNRRQHYGATGLLLLAIPLLFSMERRKYEEAGRLIGEALEIEPDNAMVAAWAAHWHCFYVGQGWSQNVERSYAVAQDFALKGIKLDPDNAEALGIYAHICSVINKDFDSALRYFDRSLRANPNLAFIWALSAATYCYIGEPEIALQRLERYRELAPFDPYFSNFEAIFTIAYAFKGDHERAILTGRRFVKSNPHFVAGYKPLIASLGHLGRRDEAKPYVDKLLTLDPGFTVERFGETYPFKRDQDRRRYMQGLRLAGVPER
jgi:DNA-binding SARP family transcriptional activator/TolB-like protein/Tfp pilus assembly protein PilF